jgi:hypothetical protein
MVANRKLKEAVRLQRKDRARPHAVRPLLVAAVLVSVCLPGDSQQRESSNPYSGFRGTYVRAGQVATEITITGTELTRTITTCHNAGRGQSCENPTAESAKGQLNAQDVEKLKSEIEKSGFLNLRASYETRGFSYPKTITVQMGGKTKKVEYRGRPETEAAPQAFSTLEQIIATLADRAFRSAFAA